MVLISLLNLNKSDSNNSKLSNLLRFDIKDFITELSFNDIFTKSLYFTSQAKVNCSNNAFSLPEFATYFCCKFNKPSLISSDNFSSQSHFIPKSRIISCILISNSCKVFQSLTNGAFLVNILSQPTLSLPTISVVIVPNIIDQILTALLDCVKSSADFLNIFFQDSHNLEGRPKIPAEKSQTFLLLPTHSGSFTAFCNI